MSTRPRRAATHQPTRDHGVLTLDSDLENEMVTGTADQSDESKLNLTNAITTDDDSDEEFQPRARKRRKASKNKDTVASGALQAFATMPGDVLAEICKSLDPIDLLNLSRVSKSYRRFLLDKSSRALWIIARRNVALPNLEEPMDEIEYAILMNGRRCMGCGREPASFVQDFTLRKRLCKSCAAQLFVLPSKFSVGEPLTQAMLLRSIVTTTTDPFSSIRPLPRLNYCYEPETRIIPARLRNAQEMRFKNQVTGSTAESPIAVYIAEREALKARLARDKVKLSEWKLATDAIERADKSAENHRKSAARLATLQQRFLKAGFAQLE